MRLDAKIHCDFKKRHVALGSRDNHSSIIPLLEKSTFVRINSRIECISTKIVQHIENSVTVLKRKIRYFMSKHEKHWEVFSEKLKMYRSFYIACFGSL